MFDLKTDPLFPHHYLISVGMKTLQDSNPGIIYLKYSPVYFTNEDVENVRNSLILCNDKLYTDIYKMTNMEIYQMNECSELIMTIISLKHASRANFCTLHHFSIAEKLEDVDSFFENMVKKANRNKKERKKLNDAKV